MKHENILSLIGSDASPHSRPYPDILHVPPDDYTSLPKHDQPLLFDLQNQDINNGVSKKVSGN